MLGIIIGFIIGICIGSFLNVCIDRLPRGQSIVSPPSHCPTCGRKLKRIELIPLVSYLWLRGRCRSCGTGIPRRVVGVELGTGFLFAFLSFSYGFGVEFLVLALCGSLFLVLAVIDLEHGLILNKIVYPAIGISLLLSPFWPSLGFGRSFLGESGMIHSFLGSLSGGLIFAAFLFVIALISSGGMGWGDVKMAALIGLITGFPSVLMAMMLSLVSSGIVAILLLALRLRSRKEAIPFGPFLSLGAFIALLWGQELITWYLGLLG
ncbi:prepilin peptidase [Dehalococcoidia bacterium]|nr:prepilin peptidase [Dehalococcoidia bacterium]